MASGHIQLTKSIYHKVRSKAEQWRIAARHSSEIEFHKWPWSDAQLDDFASSGSACSEGGYRSLLETELRAFLGVSDDARVSLVGSGRTALRLGLTALRNLRPERRHVVVPTYCCGSVHEAVVSCGLVPVYVDTTDNLISNADQYLGALDDATLAIIIVNLCGRWMEEQSRLRVLDVCRRSGAFVVEDNAQCYRRSCTASPDLEVHSFGFGKLGMATAGGALVSWVGLPEIGEELRNYRSEPENLAVRRFRYFQQKFGSKSTAESSGGTASTMAEQYGKVFLSDVDAGLALGSLQNAAATIEQSIAIGDRYVAATMCFPDVYHSCDSERNIFFRFPVVLRDIQLRNSFWTHMRLRKIELEGMYMPLHLRYPNNPISSSASNAEALYQCVFNIPNRVTLSSAEIDRIVDALMSFGKRRDH